MWQQLKLDGFKLSLLWIVGNYEHPNAVYQSAGHPIFMIFCGFWILQQSYQSIRQCHVQNFTFSGPESAESQFVCSQYKRRQRIWVYKGEIQHRERMVKVR